PLLHERRLADLPREVALPVLQPVELAAELPPLRPERREDVGRRGPAGSGGTGDVDVGRSGGGGGGGSPGRRGRLGWLHLGSLRTMDGLARRNVAPLRSSRDARFHAIPPPAGRNGPPPSVRT